LTTKKAKKNSRLNKKSKGRQSRPFFVTKNVKTNCLSSWCCNRVYTNMMLKDTCQQQNCFVLKICCNNGLSKKTGCKSRCASDFCFGKKSAEGYILTSRCSLPAKSRFVVGICPKRDNTYQKPPFLLCIADASIYIMHLSCRCVTSFAGAK